MAMPTYDRTNSASSLRMVEVGIRGLLALALAARLSSEEAPFSPSCSFFSSRISSGVEARDTGKIMTGQIYKGKSRNQQK